MKIGVTVARRDVMKKGSGLEFQFKLNFKFQSRSLFHYIPPSNCHTNFHEIRLRTAVVWSLGAACGRIAYRINAGWIFPDTLGTITVTLTGVLHCSCALKMFQKSIHFIFFRAHRGRIACSINESWVLHDTWGTTTVALASGVRCCCALEMIQKPIYLKNLEQTRSQTLNLRQY